MLPALTARRSPVAAIACLVLGALALLAGALVTDAWCFLRPDGFADHAAASLGDPRVAAFVADRVTDAVLAQKPDLVAYRPLLLAAGQSVVVSNPFRGLARGMARRAYAALVSGIGQHRSVVFSVDDRDVVLRDALAASPAVARALPDVVAGRAVVTPVEPAGERTPGCPASYRAGDRRADDPRSAAAPPRGNPPPSAPASPPAP